MTWSSVEHYYQASKFKINNPGLYRSFALESGTELSKDPAMAKSAGGKNKLDPDFFTSGRSLVEMRRAQKEKFTQHNNLRNILLATKNAKLVHYVRGSNPIVFIDLMVIRSELSSTKKPQRYYDYVPMNVRSKSPRRSRKIYKSPYSLSPIRRSPIRRRSYEGTPSYLKNLPSQWTKLPPAMMYEDQPVEIEPMGPMTYRVPSPGEAPAKSVFMERESDNVPLVKKSDLESKPKKRFSFKIQPEKLEQGNYERINLDNLDEKTSKRIEKVGREQEEIIKRQREMALKRIAEMKKKK
jgi:hypothetical protein